MRAEMGIDAPMTVADRSEGCSSQKYRGSRYSASGYPACPDMSDQEISCSACSIRGGSAVDLTENWQIDPEQSTSAIVVHHPQAKYFNA
jgi:5-methyltetrahydrofolate--homocysteine methyltransferase